MVRDDQPDAREGQAGRPGVAERFAVLLKPGNAGGGKGPQFKTDATRQTLLIFWSPRPVSSFADIPDATWDRDGVLCPQHAAELEAVLKLGLEPTAAV